MAAGAYIAYGSDAGAHHQPDAADAPATRVEMHIEIRGLRVAEAVRPRLRDDAEKAESASESAVYATPTPPRDPLATTGAWNAAAPSARPTARPDPNAGDGGFEAAAPDANPDAQTAGSAPTDPEPRATEAAATAPKNELVGEPEKPVAAGAASLASPLLTSEPAAASNPYGSPFASRPAAALDAPFAAPSDPAPARAPQPAPSPDAPSEASDGADRLATTEPMQTAPATEVAAPSHNEAPAAAIAPAPRDETPEALVQRVDAPTPALSGPAPRQALRPSLRPGTERAAPTAGALAMRVDEAPIAMSALSAGRSPSSRQSAGLPAAVSTAPLQDAAGADGGVPRAPRSGATGYMLVDLAGGRILARREADQAFIPASVAKAPTAVFALETLGADFRFETWVYADGPIRNGVLDGDLYLVGGGDPTLDTADLAEIVETLHGMGLRQVAGAFYYDDTALPNADHLEPGQPIHAAYNPAIGGLNLNFNRVLLKWRRVSRGDYDIELNAHSSRRAVPASAIESDLVSGSGPRNAFDHGFQADGDEVWTIATRFLSREGSRWLPVRRPGVYAATTFRTLAAEEGITLPPPAPRADPGGLRPLTVFQSDTLADILRGMLKFSTNLTAEAVGIAATRAQSVRADAIGRSGARMTDWVAARYALAAGPSSLMFRNHSGLSSSSRLTPRHATTFLVRLAMADGSLHEALMAAMPRYKLRALTNATVWAKTGTMYYGRGLMGYIACNSGRELAFSTFTSDVDARARLDAIPFTRRPDRPRGAVSWLSRARQIERGLLISWTDRYC